MHESICRITDCIPCYEHQYRWLETRGGCLPAKQVPKAQALHVAARRTLAPLASQSAWSTFLPRAFGNCGVRAVTH